jgi:hypothetical protein
MSFNVSDKVVCVDDSPGRRTGSRKLVAGQVYVVRESVASARTRTPCVRLVGIINMWCPHYRYELPFDARRFRKLEEVQAENRLRAEKEAHA